jgi:hypothetical protein
MAASAVEPPRGAIDKPTYKREETPRRSTALLAFSKTRAIEDVAIEDLHPTFGTPMVKEGQTALENSRDPPAAHILRVNTTIEDTHMYCMIFEIPQKTGNIPEESEASFRERSASMRQKHHTHLHQ